MSKEIEKWWDISSEDYQKSAKVETKSAHYGPYAPNENKLRLLGKVKGKKILEIGCGGGQCSIAFAKQGAICKGLDLSQKQIDYAKALAKKEKVSVQFLKHNIQTLKNIKSNSYDIVFSAYALQYVPNLKKCFNEVYRVLKKKGLFVFSFDHPFYTLISTENHKLERNYNTLGKIEEIEPGPDGINRKFIAYFRKISEIIEAISNSGFILEKMIEPFDKKSEKGWRKGYWKEIYPKNLVEKISPTIIFKARKK